MKLFYRCSCYFLVVFFALFSATAFAQEQVLVLIPPNALDFYTFYKSLSERYCYCCYVPDTPSPSQRALEPSIADVNGGSVNPQTGLPTGNGMLDAEYEMAMIEEILKAPAGWKITGPYGAGVDRDKMTEAWNRDITHFLADLGNARGSVIQSYEFMCDSTNYAGYAFACINTLLLIGDSGSLAGLQDLCDSLARYGFTTSFSPSHYGSFPYLLGPDGDADRDGFSNRQEYDAFGPSAAGGGPAAFLSAVLDPNIKPEGAPLNTDDDQDGLTNDREDLNLNGVVDPGESDPLNPDSDGDGLGDAVEVLQWGSDPLSASDCPQVPATTPGALAALGLALGVLGLRRVARG